jgi:hypothetical protein
MKFRQNVRTPEIRCLLKNDLRQPLIGNPASNKTYGRHRCRRQDNIKTGLEEIQCVYVD